MESVVDDVLSILSPDPKQYTVLAHVPWRVSFSLITQTSVSLFLSWLVQLFDNSVGFLKYKSQSWDYHQMFKMFFQTISKKI